MAYLHHRTRHATGVLGLALAAATLITATPAWAVAEGETVLTSGVPIPDGFYAASGSAVTSGGAASPISSDGRYVAFTTNNDDLAPGIHPDVTSVIRKDRQTGAVEFVSRASGADGAAATRPPGEVLRISNDGNLVAFTTYAVLDPDDLDRDSDVYVRNVAAGTTTLATPNVPGNVLEFDLAGDGTHIAFTTSALLVAGDGNGLTDVYRRSLGTGLINLASRPTTGATPVNAASRSPAISDDGRWVAFSTGATNVIGGFVNGTGNADVYARDMTGNVNYLVSARFDAPFTGGNAASTDPMIAGRPGSAAEVRIAYSSDATILADNAVTDASSADTAYLRPSILAGAPASIVLSRATGAAGANADAASYLGGLSDDGQRVLFFSDATNLGAGGGFGAYLRDLNTDTTTLVSADNEYAIEPSISGDGTYATWYEQGDSDGASRDVPSAFGRLLPSGGIELVSRPPGSVPQTAVAPQVSSGGQSSRTVSNDGRYVIFAASGGGLGVRSAGFLRPLVYRRDVATGVLELVSRATGPAGPSATDISFQASVSADGNRVAFLSISQLDPADTDTLLDAYVRDMSTATTTLVSRADGAAGAVANGAARMVEISADGSRIAFVSDATNLGAPTAQNHVYVRDLAAQTTTIADRAGGVGGVVGNGSAEDPSLSADGTKVVFATGANNLSPDDAVGSGSDVYVRDLTAATTTLVSRRTGIDGAKLAITSRFPVISSDGSTVAFQASDENAATEAGPWSGEEQLVVRTLASGSNALGSRGPGAGAPANATASNPTLSADGTVIAFESEATNLLPGLGGLYRSAVFVRKMSDATLQGPPAFGLIDNEPQNHAWMPSLSDDGRCLAFMAQGHTDFTGKAGDTESAYLYAVSGPCPIPPPAAQAGSPGAPVGLPTPPVLLPALPVLTKVSVSNTRFKIGSKQTALKASAARAQSKKPKTQTGTTFRFTLNTAASVDITIARRVNGRQVGKQCLKNTKGRAKRKVCKRYESVGTLSRANLAAGEQTVAFTGRLGRKRLATGPHRATFQAANAAGTSGSVPRTFTVVRR